MFCKPNKSQHVSTLLAYYGLLTLVLTSWISPATLSYWMLFPLWATYLALGSRPLFHHHPPRVRHLHCLPLITRLEGVAHPSGARLTSGAREPHQVALLVRPHIAENTTERRDWPRWRKDGG